MAATKERLDKHDRQIGAILKLVQTGMKMLVENQRQLKALTASQKRTESTLQAFIDSMRRGGNGRSKSNGLT